MVASRSGQEARLGLRRNKNEVPETLSWKDVTILDAEGTLLSLHTTVSMFSSSTTWDPGPELKSSCLVASSFVAGVTLPALFYCH